jgi:hypothetical protein
MKQSNPAAKKSPQNFRAHQSPLQQSPHNLQQGLQPMMVSPSHTIVLVGLGDGTTTSKQGERRISVVTQ